MSNDSTSVIQASIDAMQEQLDQGKNVSVHVGQTKMPIINQFVLLFFDAFADSIDEYNLSRNDLRVLLRICKRMQFGNLVKISWAGIGKELGINKHNMTRHIKNLKDANIMIEDESGNTFLNPQIIAKGKFLSGKDETSIKILDMGADALEGTKVKPSIMTPKLKKKLKAQENNQLTLLDCFVAKEED